MAKPRRSVQAELDQLRQQAADERTKQREAEAALVAAKAEVEQASRAVADAYALEDQRVIAQAHRTEEAAAAEVRELYHRVDGAALRVERAQAQLDGFLRERARDLLEERDEPARTAAAELTAAAHELLRLHRVYLAERTTGRSVGRRNAGGLASQRWPRR